MKGKIGPRFLTFPAYKLTKSACQLGRALVDAEIWRFFLISFENNFVFLKTKKKCLILKTRNSLWCRWEHQNQKLVKGLAWWWLLNKGLMVEPDRRWLCLWIIGIGSGSFSIWWVLVLMWIDFGLWGVCRVFVPISGAMAVSGGHQWWMHGCLG